MAPRSTPLVALLLVGIMFAGCVGDKGSDPLATSSPSSTVSVTETNGTASPEVGKIEGTIIDIENAPIPGVSVAIHGTEVVATTDDAGHYAFVDVPVGEHDIMTNKLGYENGAERAQVVAGETVYVNMTLNAIEIAPDPYHTVTTWEGLISCGAVFIPFCGILDEAEQEYGTPNPTEEHWLFRWSFADPRIPSTVVFELVWQPTVPGSAPTFALLGTDGFNDRAEGPSVLKLVVKGSAFDELEEDPAQVFGIGVYPGAEPVVNQRFTLYRTDFYNGEAPEDYSVLDADG